ncbi:hypothetical protein HK405_002214, partial [Cladochytrium tenue]
AHLPLELPQVQNTPSPASPDLQNSAAAAAAPGPSAPRALCLPGRMDATTPASPPPTPPSSSSSPPQPPPATLATGGGHLVLSRVTRRVTLDRHRQPARVAVSISLVGGEHHSSRDAATPVTPIVAAAAGAGTPLPLLSPPPPRQPPPPPRPLGTASAAAEASTIPSHAAAPRRAPLRAQLRRALSQTRRPSSPAPAPLPSAAVRRATSTATPVTSATATLEAAAAPHTTTTTPWLPFRRASAAFASAGRTAAQYVGAGVSRWIATAANSCGVAVTVAASPGRPAWPATRLARQEPRAAAAAAAARRAAAAAAAGLAPVPAGKAGRSLAAAVGAVIVLASDR